MAQLNGRVALVTGGGTGIGRGVALALAREGARVMVCGRRWEPLAGVVEEIAGAGGEVRAVRADVSEEDDVARLVEDTLAAFGAIDIAVNNAGIGGGGQVHEHDVDDWDQTLKVDLRGPFLVARAVLPHMRERRSGHLINISSEAGLEHYVGGGAYGVAKHGLNALGEYIQRENQEFGIKVNTICPGMVVSDMTRDAEGLDQSRCLYPEDIADLVLWLVTRRRNLKIGLPILIQTMENPWRG